MHVLSPMPKAVLYPPRSTAVSLVQLAACETAMAGSFNPIHGDVRGPAQLVKAIAILRVNCDANTRTNPCLARLDRDGLGHAVQCALCDLCSILNTSDNGEDEDELITPDPRCRVTLAQRLLQSACHNLQYAIPCIMT